MGSIIERPRKDGTVASMAQIAVRREGRSHRKIDRAVGAAGEGSESGPEYLSGPTQQLGFRGKLSLRRRSWAFRSCPCQRLDAGGSSRHNAPPSSKHCVRFRPMRTFQARGLIVACSRHSPKQRRDSRSSIVGSYPNSRRLQTGFVASTANSPKMHQISAAPWGVLAYRQSCTMIRRQYVDVQTYPSYQTARASSQ